MKDTGVYSNITNDKSSIKRIRIRKKLDIHRFLKYIYHDVDIEEEYPLFIERKYEKMKEFEEMFAGLR